MMEDRMPGSHGRDAPVDAWEERREDSQIWGHHERLLDALHEALEGAECLPSLDDDTSLGALEQLLWEATLALRGLRNGDVCAGCDSESHFEEKIDDVS